ncbi:MAG: hypothetical protein COS89_06985 [Deltaproteobacteria bacterium CG07_land_8_20_14_0_80_38_7]|nr:MAG: hypothetical protein COS89_06985 [Deltaproteobacteria bacterium CG07_land_8_20_14_0_80_38_7]
MKPIWGKNKKVKEVKEPEPPKLNAKITFEVKEGLLQKPIIEPSGGLTFGLVKKVIDLSLPEIQLK